MSNSLNVKNENQLDKSPFEDFKIDDNSILDNLQGRQSCPKCGKSRKYFCYTCYIPISSLEGKLPTIKLPVKIDIIKHKHEIDGKSTAIHAALLSNEDVRIFIYPHIPDYKDENVVLIFPGQNAISISQLLNTGDNYNSISTYQNYPLDELPAGYNRSTLLKNIHKTRQENRISCQTSKQIPITRAIFIDSTWHQCKSIYKDPQIRRIPCVVIQHRISQFWRHQKGSPRWYLATIEAIHQFVLEIHLNMWGLNPNYKGIKNCFTENGLKYIESLYTDDPKGYNGDYDNLLYFFKHMYDVIHKYYKHEELYAYKRRLV